MAERRGPVEQRRASRSIDGTWMVTGAAGRIGSRLRPGLAAAGVRLRSLDIADVDPVDGRDEVYRADVRDLGALTAAFADCAGIIHLGAIPDEDDFHDLADVNILGTYHVLEAARRAQVPRVVFASSNRLTGGYPRSERVSVDMPPRPDGFYGVSKVAGEALCRLYSDKFGLSTIAVRIGTYAAEPDSQRTMRTWLSHDDALRAFLAAMTTEAHHAVFYGVSANNERWWDTAAGDSIGYHPRDDSADHGEFEPVDPDEPQGGKFASPEFSLHRMRKD